MKVLIVDGHPPSAEYLRQGLYQNGFNVDVVHDGIQGRELALCPDYSLVVLELELPSLNGRALLQALRQARSTPAIVVSARDSPEDQVCCLHNGADDSLVKPVALPVFLARARLRMRGPGSLDGVRLTLADLVLDLSKKRAERAGHRLDLTRQEFGLLWLLLQRQGEVVTRAELVAQVWSLAPGAPDTVVDVAVCRLRSKLDDPYAAKLLHTVRGMGYLLELRTGAVQP
jgi:two-component system copper resistance phosphate regulon response regulator CusR